MTRSIEKHGLIYISNWIQDGLVFLACFFYLFFRIHPVLILEAHAPVFLKGYDFLSDFLKIPGGLTDWFSALLMQFWFSDFLSALFLTLCFWIIGFLTKKWIETLSENRPIHTSHLIPVCLLLVLYSNYEFDLSVVLAIIFNLFFLISFNRWSPVQQSIRIGLGSVFTILLYWVTGGAFLIFAVLCGIADILFRKKIVSGLFLLLISALLPYAASVSVFLITLKQAYLHNLTFENPIESGIMAYSLPAFFLLTPIIILIGKLSGTRKLLKYFFGLAYVWKLALGTILLLGGTILMTKGANSEIRKNVFQINRAVGEERWKDVLELTKHCSNETPLILSQSNLALYQTGKLLDSMFAYPQSKGVLGLLMNLTWCLAWPEEASNVNWKLGLVNESLHYAHEAFEHKGPTSDLLKHLGEVYMLKGDYRAADRFFLNLRKVPFREKIAGDLIRYNENPSELVKDSAYKHIQSCMPVNDLPMEEKVSSSKLDLLLKRNPENKMAFEYMIAYHLLSANIKQILDRLPEFKVLNYAKIPRHIQEALIIIPTMTANFDLNILKSWIDPTTIERFVAYRQILSKHKGDRNAARYELQAQFGDTYWYYLMFVKPGSIQPESQHEYQ